MELLLFALRVKIISQNKRKRKTLNYVLIPTAHMPIGIACSAHNSQIPPAPSPTLMLLGFPHPKFPIRTPLHQRRHPPSRANADLTFPTSWSRPHRLASRLCFWPSQPWRAWLLHSQHASRLPQEARSAPRRLKPASSSPTLASLYRHRSSDLGRR